MIATSLITTVSEEIRNTLHDKSLSEKNRNEDRRGQYYLNLDLSAMSELQNRTHFFFLVQIDTHTHTYTQWEKKARFYFNQVCKVLRNHSGPCVYICMEFQDRAPTENKGCTEWMSEMLILCRTSISYQEFENRERLFLCKIKMEKDLKK